MKCAFCEHELISTTKNEERRNKDGNLVIFSDVPVLFCPHCKEYFYHEKVLDLINDIIEKELPTTTSVPRYIYDEEAASLAII
ncbi:MAG: YgiT-type zinc finger protein [Clostridia bacterium]|nr:YgiT-type zinc finger protein [Clostridia bacterium]MDD4047732.1 YgiT-type zinc finger protein [Clostridia bacterium]